MDIAIQYQQNLEKFVAALNQHGKWNFDNGRKFTRVFETLSNGQNVARYFVDKNSQVIYSSKSWNQYNPRRVFGTLSTIDQWDFSGFYGVPKPGTNAEKEHNTREAKIAAGYSKRGRPKKAISLTRIS